MWTGLWENEETGICVSDSESERESRLQIEELAAGIDARLAFRNDFRKIREAVLAPMPILRAGKSRISVVATGNASRRRLCRASLPGIFAGHLCRASGEWEGPRWTGGGVGRTLQEPRC